MDPRCAVYCAGNSQKRNVKNEKPQRSGTNCYKAGIITRNPFFNFLRTIRETHCGLKITEIAKYGGELWSKMNDEQKCPFYMQAHRAIRRKRRSRRTPSIKDEKKQAKNMKKSRLQRPRMKTPRIRQMRKKIQIKNEKN